MAAVTEAGSMAATDGASAPHPVTLMANSEGRLVVLFFSNSVNFSSTDSRKVVLN